MTSILKLLPYYLRKHLKYDFMSISMETYNYLRGIALRLYKYSTFFGNYSDLIFCSYIYFVEKHTNWLSFGLISF